VDIISKAAPSTNPSLILHSTAPGTVASTLGGVARNVAEAAHRIHTSSNPLNKDGIMLISPLGRDSFGSLLKQETAALGMRTDGLSYPTASSPSPNGESSSRTAVCNMVIDGGGNLVGGVADMDIIASMQFKEVKFH
jgi:pseudouridylate synthase / pseudouridine kinase